MKHTNETYVAYGEMDNFLEGSETVSLSSGDGYGMRAKCRIIAPDGDFVRFSNLDKSYTTAELSLFDGVTEGIPGILHMCGIRKKSGGGVELHIPTIEEFTKNRLIGVLLDGSISGDDYDFTEAIEVTREYNHCSNTFDIIVTVMVPDEKHLSKIKELSFGRPIGTNNTDGFIYLDDILIDGESNETEVSIKVSISCGGRSSYLMFVAGNKDNPPVGTGSPQILVLSNVDIPEYLDEGLHSDKLREYIAAKTCEALNVPIEALDPKLGGMDYFQINDYIDEEGKRVIVCNFHFDDVREYITHLAEGIQCKELFNPQPTEDEYIHISGLLTPNDKHLDEYMDVLLGGIDKEEAQRVFEESINEFLRNQRNKEEIEGEHKVIEDDPQLTIDNEKEK